MQRVLALLFIVVGLALGILWAFDDDVADFDAVSDDRETEDGRAAGTARRESDLLPPPLPGGVGLEAEEIDRSAAAVLRGRVVDDAGQPVADVRVVATNYDASIGVLLDETAEVPDAIRTDHDGRFEVAVSGAFEFFSLRAVKAGYRPAAVRPVRSIDGEILVVLDRGVAIEGRLVDIEGLAVREGRVEFRCFLGDVTFRRAVDADPTTGVYRIDGLPDVDDIRSALPVMIATAPGFASTCVDYWQFVVRAPPGTKTVRRDFVLSRGGRLRVRVRELEDGRPAAGVRVQLWDERRCTSQKAPPTELAREVIDEGTTDAEGVVELGPIAASIDGLLSPFESGEHHPNAAGLVASAPNRAPSGMTLRAVAIDGEIREIELHLPRCTGVHGRVVDTAGLPVAGAIVTMNVLGFGCWSSTGAHDPAAPFFHWWQERVERGKMETVTDADGRYRFAAVPALPGRGAEFSLAAATRLSSTGEEWFAVAPDQDFEVPDRVLSTPVDFRPFVGYVTDESDRPIAGAQVTNFDQQTVLTDEQGRFALVVPPILMRSPGRKRLEARARGYATGFLFVDEPQPDSPIHFRLGPAHELRVRVVDQEERPQVDATVTVKPMPDESPPGAPHDFSSAFARTDFDGRCRITGLGPGPFLIEYRSRLRDAAKNRLEGVRPGPDELQLRLERVEPERLDLRLRVVDADTGRPIRAALRAEWEGTLGLYSARRLDLEHVVLHQVPIGAGELRLRAPGYERIERTLLVEARHRDEAEEVRLRPMPAVVLRFEFDPADQSLLSVIRIVARGEDFREETVHHFTRPGTPCRMNELGPGRWTFHATGPFEGEHARVADPVTVELRPGGADVERTVRIDRAGELEVALPVLEAGDGEIPRSPNRPGVDGRPVKTDLEKWFRMTASLRERAKAYVVVIERDGAEVQRADGSFNFRLDDQMQAGVCRFTLRQGPLTVRVFEDGREILSADATVAAGKVARVP